MKESERASSGVERVNFLVRKAFGRRTRGDINRSSMDFEPFRIDRPFLIAQKSFFGFSYRFLGCFPDTNDDGSVLEIFPEFKDQAQIYSNLYEAEFGVKPKVSVVQSIPTYTARYSRI